MTYNYHRSVELVLVTDYLKANTDSQNITFPRDNYWYYLNESHQVGGDFKRFPRTAEALMDVDSDFLTFAGGWETSRMPQMEFILNPGDVQMSSNFEAVYFNDSIEGYPGKIVVIYKIH